MYYYYEINKLLLSIQSIENNQCPNCDSQLNFDNQNDSIYVSCAKNRSHFEIAGFKDLNSGKLALLYNNNLTGIVNKTVLKEFQNLFKRKLYGALQK